LILSTDRLSSKQQQQSNITGQIRRIFNKMREQYDYIVPHLSRKRHNAGAMPGYDDEADNG